MCSQNEIYINFSYDNYALNLLQFHAINSPLFDTLILEYFSLIFLVDSTFDIDAEIEAVNVAGVPSDTNAFDISNVYDPGASTSSASGRILHKLSQHFWLL